MKCKALFYTKTLLVMKLTALFLLAAALQVSANGNAQSITLSETKAPLKKLFSEIKKQANVTFYYQRELLEESKPVDIKVSNATLQEVLDICFKDQPFTYEIVGTTIVLKKKISEARESPVNALKENPPPPINVHGRILNESSEPVMASIVVKGTQNGTTSNADGYFELTNVDEKATLLVSGVSIESQEIKVNSRVTINITATNKIKEGEEVVVAYNRIKERSNVGAITVVKGEQIQNLPNRSFDKSLQGLVPGLLVTSGNGQPGGAIGNFVLRGIATGGNPANGETFRNPLIVMDGIPVSQDPAQLANRIPNDGSIISNPMAQLNPSDIESITVLKDAAAIALYGSKASNGVILVTTKKGKSGKTIFNFRHQTDISSVLDGKLKVLGQQEYLELLFEAYRNSDPGITDQSILTDLRQKFPTTVNASGDTSFYPPGGWKKELYDNAAISNTNEMSMSGGSEKSNFYLNIEYSKQNGIIKSTGYDRKSIRFNYENRPFAWLKIGLNTALSYNVQTYNNSDGHIKVLTISPLNPIRLSNENYIDNYSWGLSPSGTEMIGNPVEVTQLNISRNVAYRGLSKLYGEIRLSKQFTLTSAIGADFMLNEQKEKIHPAFILPGEADPGNGSIYEEQYRNANIITTNILRFDHTIKTDHSINLLAGQEAQILTIKNNAAEVRGLSQNPTQDQLTGLTIISAGGRSAKQKLLSYFGQVNYGFRSKLFLTGSIRTDGSSTFGKNERFGSYWSTGVGWVVTEEPFMKKLLSRINYLKFRGSFGPSGNSAAIVNSLRYDYLSLVNNSNSLTVTPDRYRSPGNPGIKWEETFTVDMGIELRILRERIAITADIYNRKTTNLIADNIPIPLATGFTWITTNIGDVKNTGIELSLSADLIKSNTFRWSLTANWSRNKNKLTRSYFPLQTLLTGVTNKVGEEYNSFYMFRWAGVNPANGRPQWIDSATGKPTEDYYAAKQEIVGKAQPDGFGAITNNISFRNIGLSAMVYYQYGSKIYFKGEFLQNDGLYPYLNQSRSALNRWQKPGDVALNPRRLLNGRTNSQVDEGMNTSTRYLYDGDFIRLANISLSYSFPQALLTKIHMQALKVFVQGHNLATWTKYSGQDPENTNSSGGGYLLYPLQKSYSIGLNLTF